MAQAEVKSQEKIDEKEDEKSGDVSVKSGKAKSLSEIIAALKAEFNSVTHDNSGVKKHLHRNFCFPYVFSIFHPQKLNKNRK